MTVLPGEGEFGWYNPPDLVLRGYETWMIQGRKPTKKEIEDLDLFWDRDLNQMAHIRQWLEDIQDTPGLRDNGAQEWMAN